MRVKKAAVFLFLIMLTLMSAGCSGSDPGTVPTAPSNMTAQTMSSSSIRVTWQDNSGNETGFKIERSLSAGSGFSIIATAIANQSEYTDSGLSEGTTYYYRVRAANSAGDSTPSNTANATTSTTGSGIPSAPGNLTAQAASASQINLTWADNSTNETGFRVFRSTSSTGAFTQIAELGQNTTSYSNTGLAAGTTYYYQVKSYNASGTSVASNTANATTSASATVPAAPGNLGAQAVSSSQINLTWTDNSSNETGFRVFRSTSSTGTYTQIAQLGQNATSYSNTGLTAGTTFYYQVRAYNGAGESSASNTANATTQAASNTATLRVNNNTRYAVITFVYNGGSGDYELIPTTYDMIPAGGYKDYIFNLTGSTASISYSSTVGVWVTGSPREGRFTFTGSTTLTAGQRRDVTLNISLAQVMSNFKSYSDWKGYYWYNGLMYYAWFRFYSDGRWELYDNGTKIDSGYVSLVRWDNYSDFIYFSFGTGENVQLYYLNFSFYYQNGPPGWETIQYVLQ